MKRLIPGIRFILERFCACKICYTILKVVRLSVYRFICLFEITEDINIDFDAGFNVKRSIYLAVYVLMNCYVRTLLCMNICLVSGSKAKCSCSLWHLTGNVAGKTGTVL
jgi:hypothetical protein